MKVIKSKSAMFRYCCVISIFVSFVNGQFLGDNCTLPSGSYSQCVLLSQCQSAIHNLRKGVQPQRCGFLGHEPIVCCPKENNNSGDGYRSKKACEEYINHARNPPQQVYNGSPATAGEFPHMVALGFGEKNEEKWLCGGTLISEKFVLTAAHCLISSEFGPVQWARMGTYNLIEPYQGGSPQDFEIVNRLPHPAYRPPSKYNDIALLEINKAAAIYEPQYVLPACINTNTVFFNPSRKVQAVGWGRLETRVTSPNHLMKVDLELYSNEKCKKSYSNVANRSLSKGIDDESQVCAGGSLNESKDTCQGDSGGPLHVLTFDETFVSVYTVIGVTSFGKSCGIANVPGIYTRVSHFIPWIENIVWPDK